MHAETESEAVVTNWVRFSVAMVITSPIAMIGYQLLTHADPNKRVLFWLFAATFFLSLLIWIVAAAKIAARWETNARANAHGDDQELRYYKCKGPANPP